MSSITKWLADHLKNDISLLTFSTSTTLTKIRWLPIKGVATRDTAKGYLKFLFQVKWVQIAQMVSKKKPTQQPWVLLHHPDIRNHLHCNSLRIAKACHYLLLLMLIWKTSIISSKHETNVWICYVKVLK